MKRFTLFFAMASLLWCLAAWAEEPEDYEYVPLVREGIEWTYLASDYESEGTDEPYYFHMQMYGDTVVDGVTYKKCYMYRDSEFDPNKAELRGLLREDGKKVTSILLLKDGPLYEKPVLNYDFNAGIGETFSTYSRTEEMPVMDIDYVMINGKQRKRIVSDNLQSPYPSVAVEGFGFLGEIMGDLVYVQPSIMPCLGCYRAWLMYVKNLSDGTYEYNADEDDLLGSVEGMTVEESGLRIRKEDGKLYVGIDCDCYQRAELTTAGGMQVWSGSVTATDELEIPTEGLATGVYIVTLRSDFGSVSEKVVL